MKFKSLTDLSCLYDGIAADNIVIAKPATEAIKENILLTDATQYVPVKVGSALGGGPAVKKHDGEEIEPLAPNTGPAGLKGNNFKEITKIQDPGADEKVMKKEEEHDEEVSKNVHQADAAEYTTPKEKVKETVAENNKYNYQPKFTMSKLKFDQLYEEALKGVPFNEDADMMEQDEIMPADDMAADDPDIGAEETTVTITLDRDLAKRLHDVLMAAMGEEEEVIGAEEYEGNMAAEAIVNEPTPKEEKGNNAALQGRNNKVGDLHPVKHAAEKGAAKSEPTPKDAHHFDSRLQNPKGSANKVGAGTVATPGRKSFE
jgi:hypothetical protein